MDIQTLRSGIDTLDVSFQGALGSDALASLREAKERAKSQGLKEVPTTVCGVKGTVGAIGAKGYTFRFNTGRDGELWTFNDNGNPELWNIRVSNRSSKLLIEGYDAVRDGMWATLDKMGARVIQEAVSRVDWAVDFVAPDFELKRENMVMHWHTTGMEYEEPDEGEGSGFKSAFRARKLQTITCGKMPGRQVSIYDKRAEQALKPDSPWFAAWGVGDPKEAPQVWRVEVRAGKKHLDRNGIKTFADLERDLGDMVMASLGRVRMVEDHDPDAVTNITRVPTHALWQAAAGEVERAFNDALTGKTRGKVYEQRRERVAQQYRSMALGVAAAWAVVTGHEGDDTPEFGGVLDQQFKEYVKGNKFAEKVKNLRERFRFLDEKDSENGRADGVSNQVPGVS